MGEPLRWRPGKRTARLATNAGRSGGASADLPDEGAAVRSAPWLAFNAVELPAPHADSAPGFGPNRFLLGANLPWMRYGLDVGCSTATPMGGLSAHPEAAANLEAAFGRLRHDGVEQARVFLFCDARAGIRFSADGTPQGLDSAVFADVDVLLAAAERQRVGLFPVLFDAGLVASPSLQDGVRCGGHADVLAEATKREALMDFVVAPLLRRYGSHPAVDGWDVFDEPDCATLGMQCPRAARPRRAWRWGQLTGTLSAGLRSLGLLDRSPPAPTLVDAAAMRAFLAAVVQAVHAHTRALATVGLASTANLSLVQGLGLDFYQAHWWEPYGDAVLRRAAADFRLDRPLVLGAFPAATASKSIKTVLDTARCGGYGGALVWSLRAVDARGGEAGQLLQWVRNHSAHLYKRPVRVEVAAEAVVAVPAVVELQAEAEAPLKSPASPAVDSAEDDQPARVHQDVAVSVPGLAAAPA